MASRTRQPTLEEIENAIGPLEDYAERCHAASVALVNSKLLNRARVARGFFGPVSPHQHSWVILGTDCYRPRATVLDVTAWSYDNKLPRVLYGSNITDGHVPHGYGLWTSVPKDKLPRHSGGPTVLTKGRPLSDVAQDFLSKLAPEGLDARGWWMLAQLPVLGWPSREIIEAMLSTRQLSGLVPIDIAGMVTDRNPGNLYLKVAA